MISARAAIAGFGLALLGPAAAAHANCKPPEPSIVWSYPADGALDVPTNVRIFVLTSVWRHQPAQIRVNGQTVPRADLPFSYAPTLQPNTRYVVTVPTSPLQPGPDLALAFTTTAGPVPMPPPQVPRVDRVTRSGDSCPEVIPPMSMRSMVIRPLLSTLIRCEQLAPAGHASVSLCQTKERTPMPIPPARVTQRVTVASLARG